MHLRLAAAALLVVAGATACSDDSPPPPSPYCKRLTAVSIRLADAQRDLYTASGGPASVTRAVDALHSAQAGAPAEIRQALTALVAAFERAQHAVASPGRKSQRRLAEAAEVLSTEGRKVSDYVTSKCG